MSSNFVPQAPLQTNKQTDTLATSFRFVSYMQLRCGSSGKMTFWLLVQEAPLYVFFVWRFFIVMGQLEEFSIRRRIRVTWRDV